MPRDAETDPTDSITLGQLRAQTAAMAKQKVSCCRTLQSGRLTLYTLADNTQTQLFAFKYGDVDTLMHELDEFYPYIEIGHVAQNASIFEGSFDGEWTTASLAKRRAYVEAQLERMESPVNDVRRAAQGRLLYLLQGEQRIDDRRAD